MSYLICVNFIYHIIETNHPLGNYKWSHGRGPNKASIIIRIHVFSNNHLIYILNTKELSSWFHSTWRPPFSIQAKQRFSKARTEFLLKLVLAKFSNYRFSILSPEQLIYIGGSNNAQKRNNPRKIRSVDYQKLVAIFVLLPGVYTLELHLASTITVAIYHFQVGYANDNSTVVKASNLIFQGNFPH